MRADWARVKQIFAGALTISADGRSAYVAEACGTDEGLRTEVERLLAAHREASSFLETSVYHPDASPALATGQRIGPYEILGHIGAGGMGDVYKARDTRLSRTVAIKILPPHFAVDRHAAERFEQEARVIAALNDPHICTLHDVGQLNDVRYLVMEYLEGETLAARLERGPLKIDRALGCAIEIASALDTVHRAGLVHRDLKPANIMLTKGGAKLVDFGLSKARVGTVSGFEATPLVTSNITAVGTILGTLRYMAPEQFEGARADARTDIFAFGAVLYEMLTGRYAFDGATRDDIVAAIREQEPPPVPNVPSALDRVMRTCLAKPADDRWQTARDLLRQLRWIDEGALTAGPAPVASRRAPIIVATAGAVIGAIAIAAAALFPRARPSAAGGPAPTTRFQVATAATSDPTSFALSTDGRQLAYVAESNGHSKLWIRRLDQVTPEALDGTDGATYPFWAPDGRSVAFFADGKLKRIDVGGVLPQVIADAPNGRGGTWNHDGTILFVPSTASVVMRVSAGGGSPTPATRLGAGQRSHRWPAFLPDGNRFLFLATHGDPGTEGVFLGRLDSPDVTRVLDDDSAAVYAAPGKLLVEREGALVAIDFDTATARTKGDPTVVTRPIGVDTIIRPAFAASENGVLAHRTAVAARRQLTWVDRSGVSVGTLGPPDDDAIAAPELTRDGRQLVVYRSVEGNADVWVVPTATGVPNRFTFGPRIDALPIWAPDGRTLVFSSSLNGVWGVLQRASDGGGDDRPLFRKSEVKVALDFSPDGRTLLYAVQVPQTGVDLWAVPMPGGGDERAFPVLQTTFDEMAGQFSPDGAWLAYESNASGRIEVYVRPFAGRGATQRISVSGGTQPRWSRDGKELFFIDADEWLNSSRVTHGRDGEIAVSTPRRLFRTHLATGANILPAVGSRAQYAVAPDGRFLMNVAVEGAPAPPITITLNWQNAAAR